LLAQGQVVCDMEDVQDVKLYVYDLSKGLARSLSPVLLGESWLLHYRVPTPPGKSLIFFFKIPGPGTGHIIVCLSIRL